MVGGGRPGPNDSPLVIAQRPSNRIAVCPVPTRLAQPFDRAIWMPNHGRIETSGHRGDWSLPLGGEPTSPLRFVNNLSRCQRFRTSCPVQQRKRIKHDCFMVYGVRDGPCSLRLPRSPSTSLEAARRSEVALADRSPFPSAERQPVATISERRGFVSALALRCRRVATAREVT